MRIRQIVLVARDLELQVEHLCAVFGTEVGFRDPGVEVFGLRNAVMPIGDQFIEVVSPVEEGAPATRYLERRGGDCGYMLMLQSDDLDRAEARLAGLGVRVVWRIDLPEVRGRHLHPKDTGGTLLSLDQPRIASEWPWAGPHWREVRQAGAVRRILAAEMQARDPEALARRWGELLARRVTAGADGTFEIPLEGGTLRFTVVRGGRGGGLAGFDLETGDPPSVVERARRRGLDASDSEVTIGGARFRLL